MVSGAIAARHVPIVRAKHPPESTSKTIFFGALVGEHYDIEATEAFGVVTVAFPESDASAELRATARRATRRGTARPSLGWFTPLGRTTIVTTRALSRNAAGEDLCENLPVARSRCSGPETVDRRICAQAESLFRPFARRALRIRRPALVAIRARKP